MNEIADHGEHADVEALLPWYVNGTLTARERERTRRHLERCGECRDAVELLTDMQSAVRRNDATPIVPPANPEVLHALIDCRAWRRKKQRRTALAAGVAGLALAAFAAGFMLSGGNAVPTEPPRYRTLTSDPGATAMDYVFELRFEDGAAPADRERVLGTLGALQVNAVEPAGTYRVTLGLAARSLDELERFTDELEAMPEIRAARPVAMQLPMEQRP